METALAAGGVADAAVLAVGLDTPGPASATGVISSKGSTNFQQPAWRGYDIRVGRRVPSRPAGDLQQRRQRRRALRPRAPLRSRRRSTARRSRRSSAPGSAVASSSAARSCAAPREWPASSATCTSRWTGCSNPTNRSRVQLWPGRRPRVGRLAERHRTQPAPLLADPLPRSSARRDGGELAECGGPGGARLRRERRRAGAARSSPSRRARSGGCSRSPPTTPIPTPTSSAAASSSRPPTSATGSSTRVRTATSLREEQRAVARFAVVADLDMAGARGSALAALRAIRPERDPAI